MGFEDEILNVHDMDEERIHQQDVATILSDLQRDILEVQKKYEGRPQERDAMNAELDRLIKTADRDLSLKTQAIVRSRLGRSSTIPVNFSKYLPDDPVPLDPDEMIRLPPPDTDKRKTTKRPRTAMTPRRSNANGSGSTSRLATPRTQRSRFEDVSIPQTQRSRLEDGITPSTQRSRLTEVQTPRTQQSRRDGSTTTSRTPKSRLEETAPLSIRDRTESGTARPGTAPDSQRDQESSRAATVRSIKSTIRSSRRGQTVLNEEGTSRVISKISFARKQSDRPKTAVSRVRKRIIPNYESSLPLPNPHDPAAPPPPLPKDAVSTFGLQQLTETRLVKASDALGYLSGTVHVSKFKKDVAADYRNFEQHWVLDIPQKDMKDDKMASVRSLNLPTDRENDDRMANMDRLTFPLHKGEPVEEFPDFLRFKHYYHDVWETIQVILKSLRMICEEYGLRDVMVDGTLIVEYTKMDPDEVSRDRLLKLFLGVDMTKIKRKRCGFGFEGEAGRERAATLIQSVWRGYSSRRVIRMIMRNNTAARVIQKAWRVRKIHLEFMKVMEREKQKKHVRFEGIHQDTLSYRLDQPHCIVHVVGSAHGIEVGRIQAIMNRHTTVIFYTISSLSDDIVNVIKSHAPEGRVHIVVSSFKRVYGLSAEDVLASDFKGLRQIRFAAGRSPCIIIPNTTNPAMVDIAIGVNGFMLNPSPSKLHVFQSRAAIRRLLENAGANLFETTEELFDYEALAREIAGLALAHLVIQQWLIMRNDGEIAWVNSSDISLLEDLKAHRNILTERELEDPAFIKLVCQNVSNDLRNIIHTKSGVDPNEFLRVFCLIGGTVEAAPQHTKSAPAIAFLVPPVGSTRLVGSWEVLYLSTYEPFASIHPAFTVPTKKLQKLAKRVASECSEKRLFGLSVIKCYYSSRRKLNEFNQPSDQFTMKLMASDLAIGQMSEVLPQVFAETMTGAKFDEESMSMGPRCFTYVQKVVKFPKEIQLPVFIDECRKFGLPVGEKVFGVPNFNDTSIYSLVVMDESPERLVNLVYRVFVTLADDVFSGYTRPDAELYRYCAAVEYLKAQYDNQNNLSSTFVVSTIQSSRERRIRLGNGMFV